ncbi:MAG: MarR family transcriptional regulator [Tepidisphaeraceae bacterium]
MSFEHDADSDEQPTRGRRDGFVDLFLAFQRTADRLMQGLEDALKPTGITPVQYLVLRALREAGVAGMPSNEIARNMTTHDPDMTRLLDKLEERDVVQRWRDKEDRRIYRVRLTREGAVLLRSLTQITKELHRKQFNTIDGREMRSLTRTLQAINEVPIPGSKRRQEPGDRRPKKEARS